MNRRCARMLALAAIALAACTAPPLQPDRSARAPVFEGFGTLDLEVGTAVPEAARLFRHGVLQAYAFNEVEAVRSFKAALAQDPACAACAWGVAWQLGPNINAPRRGRLDEALRYLDHALRHAARATPRERTLIEALALRYGHAAAAREAAPLAAATCGAGNDADDPVHPLDTAYAERMRGVADAHPGDADILSLYAEAEMIATRGEGWQDGRPRGRIGELAARLERALQSKPRHTGLNHYLIHAVDAPGVAVRALAAAERLGALAPASPHLGHMPSHTYVHVGRYADATRANQAAIALDDALDAKQKAAGFAASKDWRGHNLHFLWYTALAEGRGDLALQTARTLQRRAGEHRALYAEYLRTLPLLTLLRLQRWDDVLREGDIAGGGGMAAAIGEHARGVALARLQRLSEARAALAKAEAGAAAVAKAQPGSGGWDRHLRTLAEAPLARLRAEIAAAEGRHDEALAQQAKAVEASRLVDATEPPRLAAGAGLALAELQLRAGRAQAAEQTYRGELLAHPGNGWAIAGVLRALQAQQRDDAALRSELQRAWPAADAALRAGL